MTQNPIPPPRSFQPPTQGEEFVVEGRRYLIGDQIGQGSFGAVFECTDDWGNELVAKVMLPRNRPYEEIRDHCLTEVERLQKLRHPNITFIRDAFECHDTFYIVLERCSFTLLPVINLPSLRPDDWIPWVARDILQALDYIHANGYIHKDLHPDNIFVSQTQDRMVPTKPPAWSFKIADLGISGLDGQLRTNTVWAKWMLAPEIIDTNQFGPIGKTIDIYHAGLVLLALTLNRVPTFTTQQITAGEPRVVAEKSHSKYGQVIAVALRRHATCRYQSARDFWLAISAASK